MRVPTLLPLIRSPLPVNTSFHQTPLLPHPAPHETPRPGSGSPGPSGAGARCRTGSSLPAPLGLQDDGSFQVHVFVLHRPPQPLPEDVVRVPPLTVHANPHTAVLEDLGELPTGELAPWSVLNTSGCPWPRASSSAPAQKPASRVLDSRQASTYRLCQSMTATR